MKKLVRLFAFAAALGLASVGSVDAAPYKAAPKASTAQKASPQKNMAAIRRNRAANGQSNKHLKGRKTQEHAKSVEYTTADGKGKIQKYLLPKNGSFARRGGGTTTPAQARKGALQKSRDSKGRYTKQKNMGITNKGNIRTGNYKNDHVVITDANNPNKTRVMNPKNPRKPSSSQARQASRK